MSILLDAAVVLTAATAGAATGWCLRRRVDRSQYESAQSSTPGGESPVQDAARSREVAKALIAQVHGLTTKVATQVGEHNLRVQAINDQLTAGDFTDLQAITNAVTRLVEANAWMKQQLDTAESRLESQARLIESHVNEARTDALTGIANRRAFDEEMRRCLERVQSTGTSACLMMIDVDLFKKVNDTYGHKAGDEVLRHVARTLKQEAGDGGIVCRYGGEEFAVIFTGLPTNQCLPRAETCRAAIAAKRVHCDGQSLHVHASAGLTEFTPRDTPEAILERADEALYASKRSGRNCGHWHNGETFVPFASISTPGQVEPEPQENAVSQAGGSALVDLDTGLSTRDAIRDDVSRRLAAMQRQQLPLSLLIVQIDRLSRWRERGGKEGQTTALRTLGLALRGVSREMDHVARFEIDSFAVALHSACLDAAVEVAQRLRTSLQVATPKLAGTPTAITLSIGICEALPGDDCARLFLRAQAAQNTAANMGGDQIATHDGKNIRLVEECVAPV